MLLAVEVVGPAHRAGSPITVDILLYTRRGGVFLPVGCAAGGGGSSSDRYTVRLVPTDPRLKPLPDSRE